MNLNAVIHLCGALFCAGLACLALVRDHRSLVHRVFALGMAALGLESLFTGLSTQASLPEQVILWQQWRWVAAALVPGSWLLFTLSFARGDDKSLLAKWKWGVLAAVLVHLSLATIFAADFLLEVAALPQPHGWFVSLGWSGYVFHACFLVTGVFILMILEKTLRASKGRQRWQVKFTVLGLGALFAVRVYTGSQALIYHGLNLETEVVNAAALLVADLLILISIFRMQVLQMDIYLSQTVLYRSFTLLMVGMYLLAVGVLAKVAHYVKGGLSLPLLTFFLFLALVGLAVVLFSDRLRLRVKQGISRHLRRPQYDYRKTWMEFTKRTVSLIEIGDLCNAVARMLSEMYDTLSVSLWLHDETGGGPSLCGSTVFSKAQAADLPGIRSGSADLMRFMRGQKTVTDLEEPTTEEAEQFQVSHPNFLQEARVRYCIPLAVGGELQGVMTLGDRVSGIPLSVEELDLLKTMADQVSASILNLKLSQRLLQAKEMEAFQTIGALFVHDLKNLASKFSLLLQNLPLHFDNPAFREDALRSISQSVEKINRMCGRLSMFRAGLDLQPRQADLNEVVRTAIAGFDGTLKASVVQDLRPVPGVVLDPEQIKKVVTNLVLNADAAVGDGGEICVTTGSRDGWVELTVSDNGCGISRDFMDQCLFRPFRTTKSRGTGIGLFQCKMIVEAHKGQIAVESREGVGSTFRVFIPVGEG